MATEAEKPGMFWYPCPVRHFVTQSANSADGREMIACTTPSSIIRDLISFSAPPLNRVPPGMTTAAQPSSFNADTAYCSQAKLVLFFVSDPYRRCKLHWCARNFVNQISSSEPAPIGYPRLLDQAHAQQPDCAIAASTGIAAILSASRACHMTPVGR